MNINKKTVLITGSSRGIGYSIAEHFARNEYKVVLNCINNFKQMEEAICKFNEINPDIIGIQCDVSKYCEALKMFKEIEKTFGDIDILVNNAAVSYVGLFQEMKLDDIEHIISSNLNSVINCSHLAIASMIKKHYGHIINISSIWGSEGASCEAIYAASKGGVNAFTKSLAKELGQCNIKVNAIACGVIDTNMNNWLNEEEKENLISQIPLMRYGTTEEIAKLALFLARDECSYINGQIITVDGGMI